MARIPSNAWAALQSSPCSQPILATRFYRVSMGRDDLVLALLHRSAVAGCIPCRRT
jgi:hypothetical protein